MVLVVRVQPTRTRGCGVSERSGFLAALLRDLDDRSPSGFAIALHVRFTRPTYLFQTYSKRWMDHYATSGLVVRDPTVHWGFHSVGHVRWSDLEEIDTAGVIEQAKDFGIMNGVAVAIVRGGSRSIASFSRADREYSDDEIVELEAALAELHDATNADNGLSESERAALTALSIRLTH